MNYKAQQRIDAVRLSQSDTLDLSNLDLVALPDEVYTLTWLRVLIVANTNLRPMQSVIDLLSKFQPDEEAKEFVRQLDEEKNEQKNESLVPRQLQTIDARIGLLTALEVLDLRFNQIHQLPDTFGRLSNLRQLILQHNRLEQLPESLSRLADLEVVDVRNNPIRSVPPLPQLDRYEAYAAHFQRQKNEALFAKEYRLAAWFRKRETEFGLLIE
ncbi:leucine-rich repeat domain-containing protein [Fibrivirga algicola]|nr:leucine-rich repeat domain-containing protein [Fibrivirga algicola]